MLIAATLIAVIVYMVATVLQWRQITTRKDRPGRNGIRLLGAIAFAVHGYAVYRVLHQPDGIDLGLFRASSMIAWTVVGLLLLSSLRNKLDNLFLVVFPFGAVMALAATFGPDLGNDRFYPGPLVVHILLSLIAYSILTLASCQALLLSCQEVALKRRRGRGLLPSLPPLQVMERLLFEMIWCGFILLTIALITGFFAVDNLFAQHLVHKTVFSIAAWLVYAILLAGRTFLGWRSHTAVRWTIGGFILLALAFFGTKIVLELIFHID